MRAKRSLLTICNQNRVEPNPNSRVCICDSTTTNTSMHVLVFLVGLLPHFCITLISYIEFYSKLSNVPSLISQSFRGCTRVIYRVTRLFLWFLNSLEEELQTTASSWGLKDALIMKSMHSMYNIITYIWIGF